jgi:ElaB/YqjD/DUF883 family membrane-anchored ribosome-binding protein
MVMGNIKEVVKQASKDAVVGTEMMTSGWGSLESFMDDVDGKLKSLSQAAETAAGEARVRAHLGLMEAEDFWNERRDEVLKVAARLRAAQAKPKAALEEAKVELYFGKEDAKAAMAKFRHRLDETERNMKELGQSVNADAKAALHRLSDAYAAIRDKLLQ